MFFLVVSLFFIVLHPSINLLAQKPEEIYLAPNATLQIALQSLKGNPIFGSGPGTFSFDFLKYKNPDFNSTPLWNTTFNNGTPEILNSVATTGILGFIALLALIIFPIFYTVKFLFFEKPTEGDNDFNFILILGLLALFIGSIASYFLYNSNFVLNFICIFSLAGLAGLVSEHKKTYELKKSSPETLAITFIFTLVFIFGFGLLVLDGQRYAAEVNYSNGLASWQTGQKDNGTKEILSAVNLNPSLDLYLRQLSLAYLYTLQDKIQSASNKLSDADSKTVQNRWQAL